MSVKVKVDHSKLENTASEIERYIQTLKGKMQAAQSEIHTLSASWQGTDATQFQTKWNSVTNQDSVYGQTVKQLDSYAQYLRYAAKKYKEAQTKAVDAANRLPK
jgi:WXG100 family type VII secretion target